MTTTNAPETTFAASIQMHHATRAKAAKLAETFAAEYPMLRIEAQTGEPIDHETYTHACAGFVVLASVTVDRTGEPDSEADETDITVYEGEKVPSLALVLDTCIEEDIDPVGEEDEDDDRPSGSIVPESYRRTYKEVSSTGRCNGDWLAERLAIDTLNGEGKLMLDTFIVVLEQNGVDLTGKWAQARFGGSNGWQGRFRMNGRQLLEKAVAKSGVYVDALEAEHQPNAEWLADVRTRHAKWLAKEAKRDANAEAAIKSSVEG